MGVERGAILISTKDHLLHCKSFVGHLLTGKLLLRGRLSRKSSEANVGGELLFDDWVERVG